MKLTPYQKSIVIAVKNLPPNPSLGKVAEQLYLLGWTGEALSGARISEELSRIGVEVMKESEK